MSHKIDGNAPATMRPSIASVGGRVSQAGSDRSSPISATLPTDSIRLTGEAESLQGLQRELAAAPAIDTARVDAIRDAIQAGTYKIDPAAIASRMLELDSQLGA